MKKAYFATLNIAVAACLLAFVLTMITGGACLADIYGYQDSNGRWHFPRKTLQKNVTEGPRQTRGEAKNGFKINYDIIIREASAKYKIDPCLIKAIIWAESDFDQGAVSYKGAMGLMQLMPETAYEMNVRNIFSAKENIFGGVRYLAHLLKQFDNDIILAVAAYNAGPARVQANKRVPPIAETQAFVKRVLRYYYHFKYQDSGSILSAK